MAALDRRGLMALAGLPPLALALAGLAHPAELTPETAAAWRNPHLALLPLFPVLAAGIAAPDPGGMAPDPAHSAQAA